MALYIVFIFLCNSEIIYEVNNIKKVLGKSVGG